MNESQPTASYAARPSVCSVRHECGALPACICVCPCLHRPRTRAHTTGSNRCVHLFVCLSCAPSHPRAHNRQQLVPSLRLDMTGLPLVASINIIPAPSVVKRPRTEVLLSVFLSKKNSQSFFRTSRRVCSSSILRLEATQTKRARLCSAAEGGGVVRLVEWVLALGPHRHANLGVDCRSLYSL
jgi:hypothetical protein